MTDPAKDGREAESLTGKRPAIESAATEFEAAPAKRRRTSPSFDGASSTANDGEGEGDDGEGEEDGGATAEPQEAPQPAPRRRGRPPKSKPQTKTLSKTPPSSKAEPVTPTKNKGADSATPARRAADRSARKKSARALIQTVVGDGDGDSDDDADNHGLVREIFEDSDADDQRSSRDDGGDTTPSRTGQRKARAKRAAASPTPPRDLPPHELYFAHNKPGRPHTSDNTLSALPLLTHDEYFSLLAEQTDRLGDDVAYLEGLHAELFPQWTFELSQGFSVCLYGFGSKRALLASYAAHLSRRAVVVVNGYAPTAALREILTCVGQAVDPRRPLRLPTSSPTSMVAGILAHLAAQKSTTLTLLVNSIDAPPLRKPATQAVLAQLAASPRVHLVCSVDTPDFSLLWDSGLRSSFNFAFHDCTTFAPFTAELDVVDEVHELLDRKARRVNGREGVAFVLKSLPENAKNLFRLLVGEVLIAMEEEGGGFFDEAAGVEYRIMYNKAVEEFICTSEMAFRTLLKE